MKAALVLVLASLAPFFAHAERQTISCLLVSVDAEMPKPAGFINFDNVTATFESCSLIAPTTGILLSGVNDSACLAADNLRSFLDGAAAGEQVTMTIDSFSHSSEGGMVNGFEVLTATRAGKRMVAKTVINNGRRVKCSTTQVDVLAN